MVTTHTDANITGLTPFLRPELRAAFSNRLPAPVDRLPDPLPAPEEGDIRTRAYFLYKARMRAAMPGDELGDWLRAERELLADADRAVQAFIDDGGALGWFSSGGRL